MIFWDVIVLAMITGVILAAGKGVRMRSKLPKVLHPVAGVPMVQHVIAAARSAGVDKLVVVVNTEPQLQTGILLNPKDALAVQAEQLGTGHALMMAEAEAKDSELVLVLCGDTPLIRAETLEELIRFHRDQKAEATVLTASLENPTGYGRIIRDQAGAFVRIVEEKDATAQEKKVQEINSGMYCFSARVFEALKHVRPDNAQAEYYLTDALLVLQSQGMTVLALEAAREEDIYGINNRVQLAQAEKIMRRRMCERLMMEGVTIIDPGSTFIDAGVSVGADTVIHPFSILAGRTVIGEDCEIGPRAFIRDSRLGRGVLADSSKIIESTIGDECLIGPFAYLRPGTELAEKVKIGDFVEVKKSMVGAGSKIPHLSYVGDATVGRNVNIGAGTITCNYDGQYKYQTILEDDVFIGSNTNLVAPVTLGRGAVTGAGSTITRDLPPESLGVERAEQRIIVKYRARKKANHAE